MATATPPGVPVLTAMRPARPTSPVSGEVGLLAVEERHQDRHDLPLRGRLRGRVDGTAGRDPGRRWPARAGGTWTAASGSEVKLQAITHFTPSEIGRIAVQRGDTTALLTWTSIWPSSPARAGLGSTRRLPRRFPAALLRSSVQTLRPEADFRGRTSRSPRGGEDQRRSDAETQAVLSAMKSAREQGPAGRRPGARPRGRGLLGVPRTVSRARLRARDSVSSSRASATSASSVMGPAPRISRSRAEDVVGVVGEGVEHRQGRHALTQVRAGVLPETVDFDAMSSRSSERLTRRRWCRRTLPVPPLWTRPAR